MSLQLAVYISVTCDKCNGTIASDSVTLLNARRILCSKSEYFYKSFSLGQKTEFKFCTFKPYKFFKNGKMPKFI